MGSTSKLCEIADAGPLVHAMSWEDIGETCADASLRIAELEATIRKMVRFVPGGSSVDPQWLADELRAIAGDANVTID